MSSCLFNYFQLLFTLFNNQHKYEYYYENIKDQDISESQIIILLLFDLINYLVLTRNRMIIWKSNFNNYQ